jgi:hypothetical protein
MFSEAPQRHLQAAGLTPQQISPGTLRHNGIEEAGPRDRDHSKHRNELNVVKDVSQAWGD